MYKANYQFTHWTLGNVLKDEELNIDDELARKLGGKVRKYETKPEPVAPLAGGQANDVGSSPLVRPARKKKRSKKYSTKGR